MEHKLHVSISPDEEGRETYFMAVVNRKKIEGGGGMSTKIMLVMKKKMNMTLERLQLELHV